MTDDQQSYDPWSLDPPAKKRPGKTLKKEVEADVPQAAQTFAAGHLRAFIERIERLEEEKKAISDDTKEVYAEAKASGFDTKAIRAIVRLRKMDEAARQEAETILDLYKAALGMA